MKTFIFIGITTLFAMTGCGGSHSSTDEFITVDVNESYSTKKAERLVGREITFQLFSDTF